MDLEKIKKSADALRERKRWTRRYEVLIGNTLDLHAQFPTIEFQLTAPRECELDLKFRKRFLAWAHEYMQGISLGLIPNAGSMSESGFTSNADHEDI